MRSCIFSTGKNLIHAMRLLSLFHMLDTSLHNMSLTSDRLSEVLQSNLPLFEINSLRSEQEMVFYAFLTVKDVFVNLPTGSGKSIIINWRHFFLQVSKNCLRILVWVNQKQFTLLYLP